jgi:hypothetical protein
MTAKPELRNTPSLTVFDEILHDKNNPWQAVELAGRGISAWARCTIASAEDKTRDSSGLSDADRRAAIDKLYELGDLEDELVDLWQRRRTDEVTAAEFEAELRDIVQRLEAWPEHLAWT